MTSPSRLAGGRTRRLQTNSRAGNPIRRPPNSGSSISSAGSLSGEQNHFLPTINNSTNNSNAPERSRQQLARTLLAVACLWPLLFLIIPPPAPDPSHMAILSAGMSDAMLSYDDNNPNKSLSAKFQSIEKRAHDKIDKVRAITTRNFAANQSFYSMR